MTKSKEQKKGALSARNSAKKTKRSQDGRFMGIRIADPPVKPLDTTVKEIRRAVDAVF